MVLDEIDSCITKAFGQNFLIKERNGIFLAQILLIYDFFVRVRNQRPKIDPCAKFHPNWTKDKGSRILTSNDTDNCSMTSYTRDSDDVIRIFNVFERLYARVPFCQV